MKNDTPSNRAPFTRPAAGNLTLVENSPEAEDDAAAYYPYQSGGESLRLTEDGHQAKTTLLVCVAVSIACATAAVATGSYAAWLARHQSARQALTDVNDLLRSCQTRMRQLEADVQRLPGRQA